jgi:DNA primase
MDVIGVYSAGIKEVVASCGTALTNQQVRTIRRHADTVVVNFDPDTAGANAAERAIQLFLDEGLRVRVVALEGGLDPDEYVKQKGADAYRAKIDGASSYFHWLADRARARFDMRSAEGRMDALKFLLPAIQKLSDEIERAAVAHDVASYLGVDAGLVLERFKRAASERRAAPPRSEPRPAVPALERILLNALISSEEARAASLPRLSAALTESMMIREILDALRNLTGSGAAVTVSALDSRLTGSAQALLHEIVTADEIGDSPSPVDQAEACLRRLEMDFKRRQVDQLRVQVRTAEREGRAEEALRWMSELSRLERDVQGASGG